MGYYTDYTLLLYKNDELQSVDHDWEEELKEETGYYFDEGRVGDVKWYNHEEDMLRISRNHPDITFELIGVGEVHGDFWKKYIKNGKMVVVEGIIQYRELRPEDKEYYGIT